MRRLAHSAGLLAVACVALVAATARGQGAPASPASRPAAAASQPTPGQPAAGQQVPASQPAASQPAASQPVKLPDWAPRLSATVKPTSVLIGDPVLVTITVRHGRGVSANLPLALELGKFSEVSREESTRELGKKGEIGDLERTFKLKIAAYELGDLTLPPIEVACLGPDGELLSLTTPPMPVRVSGVLRNEPNAKPKGLEPPVSVFQRTYLLLYVLLGVAGAALIATLTLIVSRRVRARREALRPPPPPVPAHVVALDRLARLELDALLASGELKQLYLLLSEILRDYLGRRWGFDALEMTTTEIGEVLAGRELPQATRGRFEAFLASCDLVKFAKYRPEEAAARAAHAEAEALVRETAEALAQAARAPGSEAAAPPAGEAAHG